MEKEKEMQLGEKHANKINREKDHDIQPCNVHLLRNLPDSCGQHYSVIHLSYDAKK